MNIPYLLPGLPQVSAAFLLGVAALILLKAPKKATTRFLSAGLILYGLAEGALVLLIHGNALLSPTGWVGLYLVFHAIALPFWLLFSRSFGRAKAGPEAGRGLAILSFGVAGLIAFLIPSPRLIAEVDLESGTARLGEVGSLFPAYSLLVAVVLLSNLERTFRAADLRQRWQMKFTTLAAAAIFGGMIYLDSQALLFSALSLSHLALFSAILILSALMLLFSMFRGGVPEAQVYVSGRLLYQSMTVFLVGAYLLATAFISYGIRLLGGSAYLFASTFFIFSALLVLAVFLLSEGLRRRLRRFVYYHFFRQAYDYREKWMEVTQKFGSKITTSDIAQSLLKVLEETIGVNTLILWLRSGESRQLSPVGQRGMPPEHLSGLESDETLLRSLADRTEPIPVYEIGEEERSGRFWEVVAPQVIVPIVADREALGCVTLGRKVSGEPYSLEDLDLLGTIARQAATVLQTARLSAQLLAAKEMESFHLLSAFFIHDLKNFASTLSLIAENSQRRFDDPEFRGDALASIQRITDQIRQMVAKLAAVSRPIQLRRKPVDMAGIVLHVVEEVRPYARGSVEVDLKGDLALMADPNLLQNAVRNLVINANEALNGVGAITVRGWREHGSVCLAIEDNGCGMSSQFLQKELYRPFRTTKPNGAGIGLFQVRKVIEAHEGTLEVESLEGMGTTFTLRLPGMSLSMEEKVEAQAVDRG